ncbi:ATP-dependent nuclease [Nocardia rhamnosiphila]|uniref:AAA+ ATPase domain-containing protein n=1 Tax=Nocardia rhamnosiphila TaxID=426716 RepID=A0ABV2WXT4_9NOCA
MTAYYCVWVATEAWRVRRGVSGGEADVALGAALQRVCSLPSEVQDDMGVLHTEENPIAPVMIEGSRPQYMRWCPYTLTVDQDPATDYEFVRDFAPQSSEPSDILLISVDADYVDRTDAGSLGQAVYALLNNPRTQSGVANNTTVLRGASFPADEDCYLIFHRGVARSPRWLSASEEAEIRQARLPRKPMTSPLATGRLQPTAIRLTGQRIAEGDAAIAFDSGRMAVLFGRNGAGKTVVLTAIERMLQEPFAKPGTVAEEQHSLAPSLILRAHDQLSAPRQFALVLAHLAFQPLSDLPARLRATPDLPIRAWDDLKPFDPSTGATSVADLLGQPLALLQETLTAMLTDLLSHIAQDVEPLARYVATSPCVIVETGGRVVLATDPSTADTSVREAARRFVRGDFQSGMSGEIHRVYLVAEAILSKGVAAPLPTLGVQLAQWAKGVMVHRESGWLDAGEELERHLRHDLPIPVAFAPGRQGPVDLNSVAEQAVIDVISALVGASDGKQHVFASWGELSKRVLDLFREEVIRLLPRFIRDSGHLTLEITPSTLWHRQRVEGAFAMSQTEVTTLDGLPSGYAVWSLAAMTFARERLLRATWSGSGMLGDFDAGPDDKFVQFGKVNMRRHAAFTGANPATVSVNVRENRLLYFLDEPEVHLHLTAQQDVVETIGLLVRDSAGVLVATHALPFIDAPPGSATVHTLVNLGGRTSMSHGSGLRSLISRADELGIAPSALAQIYRGVLLVEGINDVEVVARYGGVDLDGERVLVIPIQGHFGIVNLAEAEFLHALGIPLYVLLDHVRRDDLIRALETGNTSGINSSEEVNLVKLHHALKATRLEVRTLPFPGVDIITAIPDNDMDMLLRACGGKPFSGWKHIHQVADAAWRENGTKFKQVFRAETGIKVDRLLKNLRDNDYCGYSPQLHRILLAMLADLTSSHDRSNVGITVLRCAD